MRVMWNTYGRPQPPAEGLIAVPYTLRDARDRVADVAGDRAFADAFFDRFVEGREVADYAGLLERAGLVLRRRDPGRAWLGDVRFAYRGTSARLADPAPFGSPLYRAGLDQDDEIVSLDGDEVSSAGQIYDVLLRHEPGDVIPVVFVRRGEQVAGRVTLDEDPALDVVPVERAGGRLTAAQRAFRDSWLATKQ
jgi:predicted metalloprotease with PDZ domain